MPLTLTMGWRLSFERESAMRRTFSPRSCQHRPLFPLRRFLAIALAATVFLPTITQTQQVNFRPIPPAGSSQEPLVYESVRGTLRYEDDGTGVREASARIHVQNALGVQKAGQLIFDYNGANERVEIRSVRVIKPDGSVVTTANGPESVQDLSAPIAREAPMYTDARQKHVTVAGLSVGDYLEYDVVTTTTKPLIPNQFWQTWNFIADAICLDEQVDLNVPRQRSVKVKASQGVTQSMREEGDRRIYHWSTSTLKYETQADLLKRFKFNITTLLEGVRPEAPRQIVFSTFGTWGEIASWYAQLEGERRNVTPEIRAQAEAITKGESSPAAKAEALYRWVAGNIRYVSLSFGLGRYQPHSAAEVLSNRYGDCKDKSTLLEALLEAEGLQADPVLVNSARDIDPDVPTPLAFDHVITLLSLDGKKVWLDSTIGAGPFGYLLPQLRGKSALVAVSAPGSGLQTTPSDLAIPTMYRLEVQENAPSNDTRNAHIALDTRGDLEVLLRLGFLQLPVQQMTEMMNRGAQSANSVTGNHLSFQDLKTSDPVDTREPFHVEATLSGMTRNSVDSDELSKGFPQIRSLLDSVLPEPPRASSDAGGAQPNIKLRAPTEFSLTLVLPLPSAPDDTTPKPESVHAAKDFAVFDSSAEWDGKALRGTWHLNILAPDVPSSRFGEYEDFRHAVFTALNTNSPVVAYLLEAKTGTSPADGNAFLTLGDSYLSMHKYQAAVKNLEKAVELLPSSERAELSLARAYLGVDQGDKAIAAFERTIAMDHSASTLNNAAYYLGDKSSHMDLAEKWAKSAVTQIEDELNQSNLGTIQKREAQLTGELAAYWDTLGWIKFREGDLDAAEKYIRAAWAIANYTDVGSHLGVVYQALHRKDQAIEAYIQTLARVASSRPLSDNEADAKRQLGVLLGSESLADEKVKEARANFKSWRSVQIDNPKHIDGSGQFVLIIGPSSKVEDIRAVQADNSVNDLESSVRAASMPQPFPDDTLQKMPRAGTISCPDTKKPCTFTLLPPGPAAQVFESVPETEPTGP
jgi:tetratricopeptide (TPR) repeat protein